MRFQLSIRDLLLSVAIVALAVGWFIDHQRISRLSVQQWEYKVVSAFGYEQGDEAAINKLGIEGWDLQVGATKTRGDFYLIFKRPRQ